MLYFCAKSITQMWFSQWLRSVTAVYKQILVGHRRNIQASLYWDSFRGIFRNIYLSLLLFMLLYVLEGLCRWYMYLIVIILCYVI